jgi:RNA polymerase sigma factor (sigma-70 family)
VALISDKAVGNDRAFERLYSNFAPNVFRYALTVLGHPADAEDVTQTTFMNAFRALQRGEQPQKPEQWLISIAHNACLQRFRHDQRRPREVALDGDLAVAGADDDRATTAEELRCAIQQLPSTQRAALVMRELEGRSYAEIAASLQVSVSALETLLFRARRTLREQLEDGGVSCVDAAAAIEMQLEGRLPISGRRVLRAHLRSCEECATLARSRRAQGKSLRGLLGLTFPLWAGRIAPRVSRAIQGGTSSGGMGAAGLTVKTAAVVVAGTVLGSGAYMGAKHVNPFRAFSPASYVSRVRSRSHSPSHRAAGGRSYHVVPAVPAAVPTARPSESGVQTGSSDPASTSTPAATTNTVAVTDNSGQSSGGSTGSQTGVDASVAPVTSSTQTALANNVPPGQAKKNANGNSASAAAQGASSGTKVPPGQAKKAAGASASSNGNGNGNGNSASAATGSSSGTNVPPGQAKKAAGASGNASPNGNGNGNGNGNAAATDTSSASASSSSAAAASSDANVPPGQAKKDASAAATTDPTPADTASSTTTTPSPPASAAPKTPPGQTKNP